MGVFLVGIIYLTGLMYQVWLTFLCEHHAKMYVVGD